MPGAVDATMPLQSAIARSVIQTLQVSAFSAQIDEYKMLQLSFTKGMVILIFFLALDLIPVPCAAETLEAPAEIIPLVAVLVGMGIMAVEIAIAVMLCQIP
jgi:hypothetical protein